MKSALCSAASAVVRTLTDGSCVDSPFPLGLAESDPQHSSPPLSIWNSVLCLLQCRGMPGITTRLRCTPRGITPRSKPLIYPRDQVKFPLSLGLFGLRVDVANDWTLLMAGNVMMTLPVLLMFFLFQRYFIQGMTMSGMKG